MQCINLAQFASNRNILSAVTRDVDRKYKIENNSVHQ